MARTGDDIDHHQNAIDHQENPQRVFDELTDASSDMASITGSLMTTTDNQYSVNDGGPLSPTDTLPDDGSLAESSPVIDDRPSGGTTTATITTATTSTTSAATPPSAKAATTSTKVAEQGGEGEVVVVAGKQQGEVPSKVEHEDELSGSESSLPLDLSPTEGRQKSSRRPHSRDRTPTTRRSPVTSGDGGPSTTGHVRRAPPHGHSRCASDGSHLSDIPLSPASSPRSPRGKTSSVDDQRRIRTQHVTVTILPPLSSAASLRIRSPHPTPPFETRQHSKSAPITWVEHVQAQSHVTRQMSRMGSLLKNLRRASVESLNVTSSPRETFLCGICFENMPMNEKVVHDPVSRERCPHSFCKHCIASE